MRNPLFFQQPVMKRGELDIQRAFCYEPREAEEARINIQVAGLLALSVACVVYSNIVTKVRTMAHTVGAQEGVVEFVRSMLFDLWMWTALVATAAGMFVYILALRRVDISFAQPIIASVFVLTPVVAYFVLDEHISPLRTTGLSCIAVGIVFVALSR